MPEFRALLEGYSRFRASEYDRHRRRWRELAEGQEPPIMIVGCCDSRVEPATIFDTEPGQTFVLRNVANIVPPFETGGGLHGASAAVEFAVLSLEVRHIVVMGHGACGGIKAALEGGDQGAPGHSFIDSWIQVLDGARSRVLAENHENPQLALELEGVRTSLTNLRSFPYVAEREQAGLLKLHGCHFSIAEGRLHILDGAEREFHPI